MRRMLTPIFSPSSMTSSEPPSDIPEDEGVSQRIRKGGQESAIPASQMAADLDPVTSTPADENNEFSVDDEIGIGRENELERTGGEGAATDTSLSRQGGNAEWVLPRSEPRLGRVSSGPLANRITVGEAGALARTIPRLFKGSMAHRPDMTVDVAVVGELSVAAVSVRGAFHQELQTPRQDSYGLGASNDGMWLIGVIADGVSEAKLSHIAADVACQTGISLARAALSGPAAGLNARDWHRVASGMRQAVRSRAERTAASAGRNPDGSRVDPSQLSDGSLARNVMATTAAIVVVATQPDSAGYFPYCYASISGDGSCFLMQPSRGWLPISLGKVGGKEILSNAVVGLPSDPGSPRLHFGNLIRGQNIVAMTDGYGDSLGDGSGELGAYFLTAWGRPAGAVEMLAKSAVVRMGLDDDHTAIVIWT
jgi:Protein phosphatase 2C